METNCLHFEHLNSTNTWSKENYKSFDPNKITLVTADEQSSGHGRYHRKWLSPAKKNIYATFTFFLTKTFQQMGNIPQVSALSVLKTLQEKGFNPLLKWPNDVLLNKKKIAGLLCETTIDENHLVVILGIGININMPLELLEQIDQPATSLLAESGQEFDLKEITAILVKHFTRDLDQFLEEGFVPFLAPYRNYLLHQKGDPIVLNGIKGSFHAIDDDGTLILNIEGKEQKFFAGEISSS